MDTDRLELSGLSGDEQLALSEDIPPTSLKMQAPTAGGGRAGEPVTIAVILLGKVALIGLSAFLLKRRSKGSKIHVGKVTLETKKGRIVATDVELDMGKENSSKEDVAKALSEKLNDLLDEYLK